MMDSQFAKDVLEGLGRSPKKLSSKYFYDALGDKLFQEIMSMEEYYLTRSEMSIFVNQTEEIIEAFKVQPDENFELIELGAGDGTKTIHLLEYLTKNQYQVEYTPVDISSNALELIEENISKKLPKLKIQPQQGQYFSVLKELSQSTKRKIIMFIGSNLGNLSDELAKRFLSQLDDYMSPGDKILLGLDLIKAEEIVRPAYDDPAGITRDFNLNLLTRINRELGANFDLSSFQHKMTYDESEGIARSYLISQKKQSVSITGLNAIFEFDSGEAINTEVSRKYSESILKQIIEDSALKIKARFYDKEKWYCDFLLEKLN